MTMLELARLANVSVSTVSKAFGGAEDINPATREHIFKLAKETGCYNKFYKGKYPKKIIAIIVHEIISNYYVDFAERLRRHVQDAGNIALIATDNFDMSTQAELIDYFSSYLRVDGIIVFSLRSKLKKSYDTPIVSLFSCKDDNVDSINIEFRPAMREAIKMLADGGHKNIAFIGESLTSARSEFFKKTVSGLGLADPAVIESGERFEAAGTHGVDKLIESGRPFSAIVCAYDNIAIGAIKRLKAHGLLVPRDVSVIGTDNIAVGEYTDIPLTTIGTDTDKVCRLACDLLEKKFKNPYYKTPERIVIQNELIIRDSVRDVKEENND